jgi:hypothetical protein
MTVREVITLMMKCDMDSDVLVVIKRDDQTPWTSGACFGVAEVFDVTNQHPVIIVDGTLEDLK